MHRDRIKMVISAYEDVVTENQYFLHLSDIGLKPTKDTSFHVSNDFNDSVDYLYPDNIDNKYFWKKLDKTFPLVAICGAPISTISELNFLNYKMANDLGAIDVLNKKFVADGFEPFLEIGYGYGGLHNTLLASVPTIDYYGIDLVKRIEGDRFFVSDGKTIPKIKNGIKFPEQFGIIYSINVFQHLSGAQRINYLRKGFKRLKPGGIFLYSCFVMTEENKDKKEFWGAKDKSGRGYCQFFTQFTECDWNFEIKAILDKIGYIHEIKIYPNTNSALIICKKPCT